jgi:osmotically-inducible protein OsmY
MRRRVPAPRIEVRKEGYMTDNELQVRVFEELLSDPKLASASIAVAADGGVIVLRGTVETLRQKLEAQRAAERVNGVRKVDNDLEVRLIGRKGKEDAELRADVLQALMLDSLVPSTIDAQVRDGWVTLTGIADYQFQRDEAECVVTNIVGIVALTDEVKLVHPIPAADDVKQAIKDSFERSATIDAERVRVSTSDDTVTLEGLVSSWAEHDAAVAAAWSASGVKHVDDRLQVTY